MEKLVDIKRGQQSQIAIKLNYLNCVGKKEANSIPAPNSKYDSALSKSKCNFLSILINALIHVNF